MNIVKQADAATCAWVRDRVGGRSGALEDNQLICCRQPETQLLAYPLVYVPFVAKGRRKSHFSLYF